MVSLPRFLYYIYIIPFFIPMSVILPFIWGYKADRISKQHLKKPKEFRGLGLPCFLHYYWAANCRAMVYKLMSLVHRMGYHQYNKVYLKKPPSRQFSFHLQGQEHLVRQSITQYLILYLFNTLLNAFLPSNTDAVFKEWNRKGIGSIKNLYANKHLCSFELFQKKYDLPKSNYSYAMI